MDIFSYSKKFWLNKGECCNFKYTEKFELGLNLFSLNYVKEGVPILMRLSLK